LLTGRNYENMKKEKIHACLSLRNTPHANLMTLFIFDVIEYRLILLEYHCTNLKLYKDATYYIVAL
jgi:hypothetical protein